MKASVVINAHREGALLVPSLRSIFKARDVGNARGHDIEIILVLDSADVNTRRIVQDFAPQFSSLYEVAYRDLGASRQFGIHRANTTHVFLHDGDDLYSSNWYSRFLDGLQRGEFDPGAVYHTALFVGFGRDLYFRQTMASDNPLFDPLYLCSEWYFSNKCVVPIDVFKKFPFPKNDIRRGVGNEDWSWSGDTIDGGVRHSVVPKTICFYRHKPAEESLGLVPGMIHHRSALYMPSRVRAEEQRRRAAPLGANPVGAGLLIARDYPSEIPTPAWVWDEVELQSKFEPILTDLYTLSDKEKCLRPVNLHRSVAQAWREICRGLDDAAKAMFFFSAGAAQAADLYLEKVIAEFRRARPTREQIVVVLDDDGFVFDEELFFARYNAKIVSVRRLSDSLKLEDWYLFRFLMRILIQFDSTVILDFGSSVFARIFREFHRSICSRHSDIRFIYPRPQVDVYCSAYFALKSNLWHYHNYTGKPGLLISFAHDSSTLERWPDVDLHQIESASLEAWSNLIALRYLNDPLRRVILMASVDFRSVFGMIRPERNVERAQHFAVATGQTLTLVETGLSWHAPELRATAADLFNWLPRIDATLPQVVCYAGAAERQKAVWMEFSRIRIDIAAYLEACLIEHTDLPFFSYLRPGSRVQEAVKAWIAKGKPISTPILIPLLLDHAGDDGLLPIEGSLCVGVRPAPLRVEDLAEVF